MRLIAYCGMAAILFKSVVMQGLVPPRREITVAGATNELITLHYMHLCPLWCCSHRPSELPILCIHVVPFLVGYC